MIYSMQSIARTMFRAYDIRGVIDAQFSENAFYTIGRAISCRLNELKRNKIFVARDGRLTSNQLAKALQQGLLDSGIDVIDLGEVPTPVMYYATCVQPVDCGLMVTGSHNPANYNGIKIILAGKTLVQPDIEAIYELVLQGRYINGQGNYQYQDLIPDYMRRIINDIKLQRPLKVVVDCGNGVAGPIVPQVLRNLGCEVIALYCDVNGHFPNHHPDPTVESNLIDLKAAIAEHQADLGFGFDGDADRLGVITNAGEIIWPDRLMMLYANEVLQHHQGATIVYDVKCSSDLAKGIRAAGGIAKMCPTGHSIVKAVMKEVDAPLAGEMSGHLFFKDRWYGFDDALYSACRLLEILSTSLESASSQFAKIPNRVNTPEIKIPIAEEKKFTFMQDFSTQANFNEANVITIDGLRVEFQDGWGLLRASNTTPCLVARFEAKNQQQLEQIKSLFRLQLQQLDSSLIIPF